jgi:hypothetical protein
MILYEKTMDQVFVKFLGTIFDHKSPRKIVLMLEARQSSAAWHVYVDQEVRCLPQTAFPQNDGDPEPRQGRMSDSDSCPIGLETIEDTSTDQKADALGWKA